MFGKVSKIYPAVYKAETRFNGSATVRMFNLGEIAEICLMRPRDFWDLIFVYFPGTASVQVIVSGSRAVYCLNREGKIVRTTGESSDIIKSVSSWSEVYFLEVYGRRILEEFNFDRRSF